MPDEEEQVQPEANAFEEADAVVIEPGGEDNSVESETNIDESVNVTVIPPAQVEEAPAAEYVTKAEFDAYVAEHSASGHPDLREGVGLAVGAAAALVAGEQSEEEVVEEPAETAIEGEPAEGAGEDAGTGDELPPAGADVHAGIWI